jgi:hypothetical protein
MFYNLSPDQLKARDGRFALGFVGAEDARHPRLERSARDGGHLISTL